VTPVASTAERIEQGLCYVDKNDKRDLLIHFLEKHPVGLVLVFVRMKHGANRLVEQLEKSGIRAEAIHGNKSQSARERALENFRSGRTRVLIATDIAARGIDVKGVALVVNFDIPNEPESYVHRIGRTARAGADGLAIAFCDPTERAFIRDIEKLIKQTIPVITDHPHPQSANTGTPRAKPIMRQNGELDWKGGRKPGGNTGNQRRRFGSPRGGHSRSSSTGK
jgi:ATP-dependent RNA helicase RhlE